MWHGSDSLSICMHFTLTKCSDGVKIKNRKSRSLIARRLPLDLAVYTNSPRPKAATTPQKQDFAASAEDPKSRVSVKGSNHALRSRILLPPPKTRRKAPRSKAAIIPRNQDFAASAEDPKKGASVKGSNHPKKSRFCCLCWRPEERRLGQRQQNLESWARLLLSALEGIFWFYLCPGDLAKQKISTIVLWIFVAFCWATIIYSFFCAWLTSIKVRVCAQCWLCMTKNTQRCPELVIITESLQIFKKAFYFFASMI